jgi:hypothetical protein
MLRFTLDVLVVAAVLTTVGYVVAAAHQFIRNKLSKSETSTAAPVPAQRPGYLPDLPTFDGDSWSESDGEPHATETSAVPTKPPALTTERGLPGKPTAGPMNRHTSSSRPSGQDSVSRTVRAPVGESQKTCRLAPSIPRARYVAGAQLGEL